MEKNKPRVLIYDIENTPTVVTTWRLWEANAIETLEEWYILSYAYKWLGESKVHVVSLPDFKGYSKNKQDDRKLCESLKKLYDEADIVVAHNGDSHDQKKSNARFIVNGIEPPSPYKSIDTKKIAKKYFKFNSNSLKNLCELLGLKGKLSNSGISLWRGCMEGCKKSWKIMCEYNKQDVVILEELYLKLRPWMYSHHNQNLITGHLSNCPKCGSDKMQKRGFGMTRARKYQRWQCQGCAGWSQSTLTNDNIK